MKNIQTKQIAEQYVLLTNKKTYFVEYLIGQLVLSHSISEAMIFDDFVTAEKFKRMLFNCFQLDCSVNTFIN